MTETKKFDPAKRKKLNNPERLQWIPPERIWELMAVPGATSYIDIGAGTGYITSEVAGIAGKGVIIHALDIEPLMVKEMEETIPVGSSIKAMLMKKDILPFSDNSIDGVWMTTLYHELDSPRPLLAEIKRVLRPQGRLLVIDWDKKEEASKQGPPLGHRVDTQTAIMQIKEAGFNNVNSQPGFTFHYGILGYR
jgi:ubiquinone/menaquinone biosynthesis C-methylase UbiE